MKVANIEDVPDISAEWYREITEVAASTPSWLQTFAVGFTEAAVVLLLGLAALAWWRARGLPSRTMGLALLAPVALVVGYLASEVSKSLIQEERPCRALSGVDPLAECPAYGDWSFPSNHSTISASLAVAVLITRPRLGAVAVPLAALSAFSRVFVGVHYPHDVIAGVLLGSLVTALVMLALARLATSVVDRLRAAGTPVRIIVGRVPDQAELDGLVGVPRARADRLAAGEDDLARSRT